MGEEKPIKYYGRRRSIIRRIGSFLPLKPAPKVYVSVTPLHSMTNSMIVEETSEDYNKCNGLDSECSGLFQNKPDLLEPISFGSEVRLLALEQELQDLREQISTIVKTNSISASQPCLSNGNNMNSAPINPPPPPPPPPLPPTTPHIARRASLQEHVLEKSMTKSNQKSMGEILKDFDKIQLKPIARSPGGRPLRLKRETSPCNDLQEILRRRFLAMQSPDSRNSSMNLSVNDSF